MGVNVAIAIAFAACTPPKSDISDGGTPGKAGAGGAGTAGGTGGTLTGGTTGRGGSAGTGGTTAGVGGTTGTAGAGASGAGGYAGGTAGTGGTGGTGGMTTGGTTGTAGTGAGGAPPGVVVQLGQTKQTMEGFGINNAWAPAMSEADADALFGTTNGLGLSILRVGMGPDGRAASADSDVTKAKARNARIIGTCFSPPAACKSNMNVNNGGALLDSTQCADAWSTTITNFAKQFGLYAMSIAHEPDFASCGMAEPCTGEFGSTVYTANQTVAFLKVVAPKLQGQGIKVIAPEVRAWLHVWSNNSATGSEPNNRDGSDPLKCGVPTGTKCAPGQGYDYGHALHNDATAWGLVDILGVHQYETQVAEPWPADVPDRKPVWQTEMSGVKWWREQGPSVHIDNGLAVAGWIHDALVRGEASAWLWFWHKALFTDDNQGLLLRDGTDTKRHYTLMNYSRFIRPGYVRVDVTGNNAADVLLSAYKGPDGTVVIVAINKGTAAASVPISLAGGTAPPALAPWVTSASDNFATRSAVTLAGSSFTATLAGKSVTTFVGKP